MRELIAVKSHIHDVVRRLMELASLEERLEAISPRQAEERTNVESLIESLQGNVPTSVLIVHNQMAARGKRSVAEVRHGVCSGCHLALAVGNLNGLRSGSLHRCGNCGRFLYIIEGDEPETKPPGSKAPPKPRRKPRGEAAATPGAKAR